MALNRALSMILSILLLVVTSSASAGVPLVTSYQGRLLDASDQPLTGTYTMVFQIFDVPTGGVPLWTEDHVGVQVTDGLFTVALGATVPLSSDLLTGGGGGGGGVVRYLQIQVAGQPPISPRTPLSAAPYAVTSGSLSGDIQTSPNLIIIGDPLTDNHATFGEKVNQGLHAAGSALSQGATRITNDCDGTSANQVMEKKGLNAVNVKLARTISSPPGGLLATDALDMDSDDDGVMDRSVSSSLDATGARLNVTNIGSSGQDGVSLSALPTTSSVAIKTKGTGADKNRITSTTNPEAATVLLEADLDGDGVMDNTNADSVGATGVSRKLVANNIGSSGQDGVSVDLRCSPDSAVQSTELRKNGAVVSADYGRHTPFHNKRTSSFFDVFTEVSIEDVCDSAGASRRLKSHNLGSSGEDGVEVQMSARPKGGIVKVTATQNSQSLRCSNSADSAAATMLVEADLDGDGLADRSISSSADATSARLKVNNIGSSGNDGVELTVLPTTSSVAIKTKGTGAEANRVVILTGLTALGTSLNRCAIDDDGDGVPESEASQIVTPTTSSVAIKTKGTGADNNRTISSTCDDSSAIQLLDIDDDGDGHAEVSAAVSSVGSLAGGGGAAAASYARMSADSDDDGVVDVTAEMAASADSASFRLKCHQPGQPVFGNRITMTASLTGAQMAVGDATCDGTNWVNASDVNAKENFTAVDGNELLDQIERLAITRWNYKGNNRAEHIGPTAQDFKAAFGVGADDKSISTIDPSGIALAAIKALRIESKNKTQRLNELQNKLQQLEAMVEKLLSERK